MNQFPLAAGVPSLGAYIPELYAKELLIEFYTSTVLAAIANTQYEGEIKAFGDKVYVRALPEVSIRQYVKGQKLQYDHMEPGQVELNIDKAYYYGVAAPKVDQVQADIAFLSKWAAHASEKLKIELDRDCLGRLAATAHAKNSGTTAGRISGNINMGVAGSPITLSNTNILGKLVEAVQCLAEQDIDTSNGGKIWAVIPAWVASRIKTSELRDASRDGGGVSMLRNGRLGVIDNVTLYQSNNIMPDDAGCYHIVVGHKDCYTFASQLVENETLKNPNDFGDLLRGLQVYGDKVTKPEGIVDLYVTAGAITTV
ncbi:MAG: hypothetical protein EOM03_12015 [Clostridia bacterium]|nr:hypothetical protein [Clostridia bacterium]